MASALTKAKIVRVKVEEGKTGLFYATSPDLNGLLVAEPTLDALEEVFPGAISALYAARGTHMVVTKAGDDDPVFSPGVAIPADQARRALERAHENKED